MHVGLGKSLRSLSVLAAPGKTAQTPLTHILTKYIKASGPISVGQYMRLALTHPKYGYYSSQNVFGSKGDFVTSPEISQMFGEIIGAYLWHHAREYPRFRYVELGPGQGTLLSDILRSWRSLGVMKYRSLARIDLVEQSQRLRGIQLKSIASALGVSDTDCATDAMMKSARVGDLNIHWHDHFVEVPQGLPPFLVAHEFLDALPVLQFQKTDDGWREVLVDVDDNLETPHDFRFVLSADGKSPSVQLFTHKVLGSEDPFKVGEIVEFSPETLALVSELASFFGQHQAGFGLLVDYNGPTSPQRSLRAISKHEFVEPFLLPGECDLTADVDFDAVKKQVDDKSSETNVLASLPLSQSKFLRSLGIDVRMKRLMECTKDSRTRADLVSARDRLVSSDQMGEVYKFMLLAPSKILYPFTR